MINIKTVILVAKLMECFLTQRILDVDIYYVFLLDTLLVGQVLIIQKISLPMYENNSNDENFQE